MFENVQMAWCGLFSSDEEWIHPDTTIDTWEAIMVVSGTVHIRVGEREYSVEKDGVILMPPFVRHAGFKSCTGVSFYWIHFTDCPLEELFIPKTESYHLVLLFRQVLHFLSGPEPQREACDYLARLILIELSRQSEKNAEKRIVYEIAEWIRINADQTLTVQRVAQQFRYNPDYLNRLFRKTFSTGLKKYIDAVRMERIKTLLLNTSEPLQSIASKCGFEDYKYFLRFFKSHQNMSPTEFRNTYYYVNMNNK